MPPRRRAIGAGASSKPLRRLPLGWRSSGSRGGGQRRLGLVRGVHVNSPQYEQHAAHRALILAIVPAGSALRSGCCCNSSDDSTCRPFWVLGHFVSRRSLARKILEVIGQFHVLRPVFARPCWPRCFATCRRQPARCSVDCTCPSPAARRILPPARSRWREKASRLPASCSSNLRICSGVASTRITSAVAGFAFACRPPKPALLSCHAEAMPLSASSFSSVCRPATPEPTSHVTTRMPSGDALPRCGVDEFAKTGSWP